MGRELLRIHIEFTPEQLAWLFRQSEKNGVALGYFIRERALNRDPQILDQESFETTNEITEWQE